MTEPPDFPSRLVWWRKRRGLSQLQLAMSAACSQRHLSFLELGRAKSSREMVLRLAAALDVPLRHSNQLLLAAGYAPIWAETDLGAPVLAPVREALDHMLAQQEPFPAVVVDRSWNLLRANRGAIALVEFLVGPVEPGAALNLADALAAPDLLKPHLANWADRSLLRGSPNCALPIIGMTRQSWHDGCATRRPKFSDRGSRSPAIHCWWLPRTPKSLQLGPSLTRERLPLTTCRRMRDFAA